MGTRSLTVFLDDDGVCEVAVMYRQYDGYISEHGMKLRKFLASVDGVSNGMGCLAAQAIMHFKSQVQNYDYEAPRQWNAEGGFFHTAIKPNSHTGGIYLYPSGTRDCGEQYIYIVKKSKEGIVLEAYFAGRKEYTFTDKHYPAVPDELIHKGLVSGGSKWTLKALEAEDKIIKRRDAEWEAQQEMKQ